MDYYDKELKRLQQEMMEEQRIDVKLSELCLQQAELEKKTAELEKAMYKEQADVDRLNGISLTAFFYKMTGRMDEKLSKEEAEAYAAAMKYDAAESELQMVGEDIANCQGRLSELQGCKEEYIRLLEAKQEQIKLSGIPAAGRLMEIEERLAFLENQQKEIGEALDAGRTALEITRQMLDDLSSAKDWSTWDMLGGGLMSDIMKYDRLDDIQSNIKELQHALRNFRTELADVKGRISADISVEMGSFLQFADFFFDGFFTDYLVYDKIKESQASTEMVYDQIQSVMSQLRQRGDAIRCEQEKLGNEQERIVLEA